MARVLGYGGLANSQERDFAGKEASTATNTPLRMLMGVGTSLLLALLMRSS